MKKIILAASILAIATSQVKAQDIVGKTYQMMVADGKLVIGGYFEKSDRRVVNNVTTWDGTKFAGLGKGVDGKTKGLASDGKNIYVAGDFTYAGKSGDEAGIESNRIAKWDGTKWVSLGKPTVDRNIFCNAFKDGKLYIGGNFTTVGGTVESKSVAMHDGKKWSSVGNAKFDRAVTAMAFLGNDLYVAGIFTLNGDEPMQGFAKWDGKTWTEAVPGGLDGIETMVADGKNLILGGSFGVKLFDGKALIEIPNSPQGSGNVYAVCADGGKIYIAGNFRRVKVGKKEVETGGFASWDGNSWTAYPIIPYTVFKCVAVYNGVLYAGGEFESNAFNGIVKFENGAWAKVQN